MPTAFLDGKKPLQGFHIKLHQTPYIIPWLKDVAVPWLQQHQLLEVAKVAVAYAKAVMGRFNGEAKRKLALTVLERNGWQIDSDEVLQAVKAKWQEMNLTQVAAVVKGAVGRDGLST